MNSKFVHSPYRCKIEQPDTDSVMELKFLKRKCGSHFVKIIWKLLCLKMSIYQIMSWVIRQYFLQKWSENKGMQKLRTC